MEIKIKEAVHKINEKLEPTFEPQKEERIAQDLKKELGDKEWDAEHKVAIISHIVHREEGKTEFKKESSKKNPFRYMLIYTTRIKTLLFILN